MGEELVGAAICLSSLPRLRPGFQYPDTAGTGASLSEVIGRGLSAESGTPGSQPQAQFSAPASTLPLHREGKGRWRGVVFI